MISKWFRMQEGLVIVALLNFAAIAQTAGGSAGQGTAAPEGVERYGYRIHQSLEIGYRGSDITGSQQTYDTLVNLRTGPRLLDQSLSMQSESHAGLLFDNLFIDSFGWGGEPNNAFRASFRRAQTDFDYNLLANPLNPPTSSPSIPVPASPHLFATRRRFSDFDLTLLPQSKVNFRLGYSRNNMTGPSYSSVHEGTDALLLQTWNTTLNSYRVGVDLKLWPGTVVSYDQFLDYYKGDTSWQLAPFAQALLPSPPPGIPSTVELGLPIDTSNKNPCAINPPATSLIDPTGTLTNTACNGYFAYNRSNRVRTSTPTERLSLRSTAIRRVDLSASFSYSSADMNAPLDEFFNGMGRNGLRQETVTGPGRARRVSDVADFGVTVHLSEHFRLVNSLRWWSYRIPSSFSSTETDWTCTNSANCSLLTPISTGTTATVAPTATDQLSFNQDWKRNQADLVWDMSKHFGASIGFRYGDKTFHH